MVRPMAELPPPPRREFEKPPAPQKPTEPRPWSKEGKALKAAQDAAKATNGNAAAEPSTNLTESANKIDSAPAEPEARAKQTGAATPNKALDVALA
jgi:hypothetical protein